MKTLFVHIGMHKTGTTSIQQFLADRESFLAERDFYYPRAGRIKAGGHLNLVYELASNWKFQGKGSAWAALESELETVEQNQIVLSAENLSSFMKHEGLKDRVSELGEKIGARVVILAFVRPQYRMIDSLYAQNARTGYEYAKFDDYWRKALDKPLFDYANVLSSWVARFDVVKVGAFERHATSQGAIEQILRTMEVPRLDDSIASFPRHNERVSAKLVEFVRRSVEHLSSLTKNNKDKARFAKIVLKNCEQDGVGGDSFSGLDNEIASAIHNHFKGMNRVLGRAFMDRDHAFEEDPSNVEFTRCIYDLDEASTDDRKLYEGLLLKSCAEYFSSDTPCKGS